MECRNGWSVCEMTVSFLFPYLSFVMLNRLRKCERPDGRPLNMTIFQHPLCLATYKIQHLPPNGEHSSNYSKLLCSGLSVMYGDKNKTNKGFDTISSSYRPEIWSAQISIIDLLFTYECCR
jgi:hypothetical protein